MAEGEIYLVRGCRRKRRKSALPARATTHSIIYIEREIGGIFKNQSQVLKEIFEVVCLYLLNKYHVNYLDYNNGLRETS